jgi:phage tail sheath protein FI
MAKKFDFLSPGIEIREIDQSFLPQEAEAAGPIIIGRSRKGPANKPVRIRNLDDFVSIFGLPVPGGVGQGDVWRNGNTAGTTYASYAAQAWLASENSPVTFVRLAGEASPDATDETAKAGWQVGNDGIGSDGNNSTAYGLFLCDDTDAGSFSSKTLAFASSYTYASSSLDNESLTGSVGGTDEFEILFDATTTVPAGGAAAVTNSGATPPVITAYFSGSTSKAEGITVLKTALQLAIDSGYVSASIEDISSTELEIYNMESSALGLDYSAASQLTLDAVDLNTEQTINAAATQPSNGALAAVIYSVTGALGLSGSQIVSSDGGLAGTLVASSGQNSEFSLVVYAADGSTTSTIPFNFDRASEKYIRNVLNTNPQLTNASTISSTKTYWLGETYKDHVDNFVSNSTAGNVYGILLPLAIASGADKNWGYQKKNATEAKSGWVIAQKPEEENLFRFKCLHVGEEIQKNYLIAIEDLALPANTKYNYSTFTVAFKTKNGSTVERYTGCNLDRNSPNYVAKRIGDQYLTWDATNKRYKTNGEFQNQSNLFYIEMNEDASTAGLLPMGFRGPVRPKGFSIVGNDASAKNLNGTADFSGAVVFSGDDGNLFKGHDGTAGAFADLDGKSSVKFVFPKMRLRENGTDGGAPNQARSYWGVRPKISDASTQNDPDFCDYVRGLPEGLEADSHVASGDFEHSFTFTMHDLVESAGAWSWAEGNYNSATSKSISTLISDGARQFVMPVWGGSDGFDITEMEPMRNSLLESNANETDHYTRYTINKAIDSVSDSEVVPANLLLAPGFYETGVTNKLINTAERRKDVLAIIDLEGDYEPRFEALASSLGLPSSAVSSIKQRNLDSSYACAFYPWVQISDNLSNNQLAWVPPSVAALGAFGRSQAQSELWFAPAGFNRGGLGSLGGPRGPKVLQARQRLDSKERDLLYEVNINPIATFPAEGVVIFGQKTLQADQSALDRINVRRLVLYLKAEVARISRNLLFDQNLSSTWNRFKGEVNPVLSSVSARFGLSDYRVVLDETTTTADLIDRNVMYAKIYIKPARAIEYIVVDFVITNTGADFA